MQADLTIKKRLLIMLAVLTLLFSLVGVRIGSLTLFQGEALTARGVRQWTREGIVTARRGAIEDTRGETLALSATAYVVTVNPQTVTDAAAFARAVAPPLGMDAAAIEKRLENKRLASVILKRQGAPGNRGRAAGPARQRRHAGGRHADPGARRQRGRGRTARHRSAS